MTDASAVPGVAVVLGALWTVQFLYFVRNVHRYAETHTTEETVAFADAIRPPVVAVVTAISAARTARRGSDTPAAGG